MKAFLESRYRDVIEDTSSSSSSSLSISAPASTNVASIRRGSALSAYAAFANDRSRPKVALPADLYIPFFNTFQPHQNRFLYLEPGDELPSDARDPVHQNRAERVLFLDIERPDFYATFTQCADQIDAAGLDPNRQPLLNLFPSDLHAENMDGDADDEDDILFHPSHVNLDQAHDYQRALWGYDESQVLTSDAALRYMKCVVDARKQHAESREREFAALDPAAMLAEVKQRISFMLHIKSWFQANRYSSSSSSSSSSSTTSLARYLWAEDVVAVYDLVSLPWAPDAKKAIWKDDTIVFGSSDDKAAFLSAFELRLQLLGRRRALYRLSVAEFYTSVIAHPSLCHSTAAEELDAKFAPIREYLCNHVESYGAIRLDLFRLKIALLERELQHEENVYDLEMQRVVAQRQLTVVEQRLVNDLRACLEDWAMRDPRTDRIAAYIERMRDVTWKNT